MSTDLGAVIQNSNSQVDLEVPADATDVNHMYEEALDNVRNRKPLPKAHGLSEAQKEELAKDYYANVRTNVLLAWVLSNVSSSFLKPASRCIALMANACSS